MRHTDWLLNEQSVLGAILIDPDALDRVSDLLTPDSFGREDHRAIYQAAVNLSEKGKPVDVVTVSDAVGHLGYLTGLARDIPSAANCRAYAELVADRALANRLQDAGRKIHRMATERPAGEALQAAQDALMGLSDRADSGSLTHAHSTLKPWLEHLEVLNEKGDITGLSTPWHRLDAMTGGFQAGDLIIVAGRPSMGKSTFAQNITDHAALTGRPAAFFSLEMSTNQVISRAVAATESVPLEFLKSPRKLGDSGWAKITAAVRRLDAAPLYIDDSTGLTANVICTRIRRQHRKEPLSVAVVDYLGLMDTNAESGDRHDLRVGQAVEKLKNLAKQLQIPIILLAQLNRALEARANKRPTMADLRDSGEIEQHADLIVFLYRPEVYDPDSRDAGLCEVILAKQRNGVTGSVTLASELHFARFVNTAETLRGPEPKRAASIADYRKDAA